MCGEGGLFSLQWIKIFHKKNFGQNWFSVYRYQEQTAQNQDKQLIAFYSSEKNHQNIPYSNRATGQNSCFISSRRDSSRWLFTRLPVIWHLIHLAALSMAFDGRRRVFRLFMFLKMTEPWKRGQIQTKTGTSLRASQKRFAVFFLFCICKHLYAKLVQKKTKHARQDKCKKSPKRSNSRFILHSGNTVDSRYLEFQGTLRDIRTSTHQICRI